MFSKRLRSLKESVIDLIEKELSNIIEFRGIERTRQFFINDWYSKVTRILNTYSTNCRSFAKNVLRKKILAEVNKDKKQLQEYLRNGACRNETITRYMPMIQDQRQICLIMDDISHIISSNSKRKVELDNGQ